MPARSGTGRRIVISQRQNWVWLVGPRGSVLAQGGIVDNPSVLARGAHATGGYCGRAARIRQNTTTSGEVWLENFVRFAPCGIGFHRIPTYRSNGAQIHADWMLGTNLAESHGCIRLSRASRCGSGRSPTGGRRCAWSERDARTGCPRRRRGASLESDEGGPMRANVGDLLLVESSSAEQHRREGEIIEVRGADGAPPFVVRWPDGHEALCYPGPDARVRSRDRSSGS